MTHILLIDDDQQYREMLTQMLTRDGHRVSIANDGEEGMSQIAAAPPELIITDVLMPKMDGIEMIQALGRAGTRIPVIAISGGRRSISPEFNLESALLMGVKVALAKPFTREELRKAIAYAMAEAGAQDCRHYSEW
jgi:CheY-like chemotaxis protein